jgi:hypothetical protein
MNKLHWLGLIVVLVLIASAMPTTAQDNTLPPPVPCDPTRGTCYAPPVGSAWQWQLGCDTPDTCANLEVQVDWYDLDWEETPATTIDAIHAAGAHAACYISTGTWEDWRADRDAFPAEVIGNDYDEWPGEKWLDVRRIDLLGPIMARRMAVCKAKGFDGVQFDNLDGWGTDNGFDLTREDDLIYAAWLANTAHAMGLSAAWENAVENLPALIPYMDWFIIEDCARWDECALTLPMITAGKFVGAAEYSDEYGLGEFLALCPAFEDQQIAALFKARDLTSPLVNCAGQAWGSVPDER